MPGPINQQGIMKYPACLLLTSLVIFPGLSSQPAAADPGADEKALAIIGQIEKNGGANQLVRDLAKLGPGALETIRSGIKKGPKMLAVELRCALIHVSPRRRSWDPGNCFGTIWI